MNGQRYQKKEEESVVPSTNAVVHLVRTRKKNTDNKIETSNSSNPSNRHLLIKQINQRAGKLIACNKSIEYICVKHLCNLSISSLLSDLIC